ncbi:LCP family protein [Nocardioides montaniterrae]
MAGGTGDKDSDGFEWMYGDRAPASKDEPTRQTQRPRTQRPAADQPEPTMMLPTQPRAGQGGGTGGGTGAGKGTPPPSRGLPPAAPVQDRLSSPVAPPRSPSRSRFSGGWSSRRRWVRIVVAVLAVWLAYTIAVPFLTWSKVDKLPFEPTGKRPADQPGTTYLMVGSDSRAGLTTAQKKEFHTGLHHNENLSDTIMLLHVGSGPDVLISFPRDWYVDGSKINGYYRPNDGRKLAKALEQQTGIRIDEYVQVGLGGVAGVVDAVGGIQICPKKRMDDHYSGLHVKKGCQEADGKTALAYARARHGQALGDLDRVAHQREVVAAVGKKVFSPWSVLNPFRWWKLNSAVPDFFAFGEGTNQYDVMRWAMAMRHAGGNGGLTCTMPVTDGSAHYMDTQRARPLFKAIIEDHTERITKNECTANGLPR